MEDMIKACIIESKPFLKKPYIKILIYAFNLLLPAYMLGTLVARLNKDLQLMKVSTANLNGISH